MSEQTPTPLEMFQVVIYTDNRGQTIQAHVPVDDNGVPDPTKHVALMAVFPIQQVEQGPQGPRQRVIQGHAPLIDPATGGPVKSLRDGYTHYAYSCQQRINAMQAEANQQMLAQPIPEAVKRQILRP